VCIDRGAAGTIRDGVCVHGDTEGTDILTDMIRDGGCVHGDTDAPPP
jgi:hypothetical protein